MTLFSLDTLALVVFFLCWIGATIWGEGFIGSQSSVTSSMSRYRREWMNNMVVRELRIVDTTIQTALLNGVAFFASTSILLAGGALTVLGATDTAIDVFNELPIIGKVTQTLWEIKVMLLVFVFTYAFFKFAWCYRLFIYVVIIIGATPPAAARNENDTPKNTSGKDFDEEPNTTQLRSEYAKRAANLHDLGAKHFNRGLRAYMFAIAAIAWFFHPTALVFSSILVLLVLYRREFRSRSLAVLRDFPPIS